MGFRDLIRGLLGGGAGAAHGKIDLADQLQGFYGQHRSGWPYVLSLLARLHNPSGILLDAFVERTFCWHPEGPRANLREWIGFIHVPPAVPAWFQHEQSNEAIMASELWRQSLPYCRGLFTLSEYHRRALEPKLDLPLCNLVFPTETPELKWSWERFHRNRERKVVQVGWWLRKLHSIYLLPTHSYEKIFLRITHADINALLRKEREVLRTQGVDVDGRYDTARSITYVPNDEYDLLLAENLVLLNLYDSSANNTVIECIVRGTPLLVNPLPAVVEYLGPDYPLYFGTLEEAAQKAEDLELVRQAHAYLTDLPIKSRLEGSHFVKTFVESEIYRGL